MPLFVRTEVIGTKLYRILMFDGSKYIGKYERSQEADIKRKKAVRAEGIEVGVIPRSAWKSPSWQK